MGVRGKPEQRGGARGEGQAGIDPALIISDQMGSVQEGREEAQEGQAGIHPAQPERWDHCRKGGRRLRSCPNAVPRTSGRPSPSPEHQPTALSPPGLGRQQRQPQGAWAAAAET